MSPAFQETLQGNELLMNSQGMIDSADTFPLVSHIVALSNRIEIL